MRRVNKERRVGPLGIGAPFGVLLSYAYRGLRARTGLCRIAEASAKDVAS